MTDQQLTKILTTLGKLDERTENIERAVLGNGQPGLKQAVEDLKAKQNRAEGAAYVALFLVSTPLLYEALKVVVAVFGGGH